MVIHISKTDIQGFSSKDYDKMAIEVNFIQQAQRPASNLSSAASWAPGDIGRIYSVKDGIVRIKGLNNVVSNEKIRFSSVYLA